MGMMIHRHKPVVQETVVTKVTEVPKVADGKEKKVEKPTKVKK